MQDINYKKNCYSLRFFFIWEVLVSPQYCEVCLGCSGKTLLQVCWITCPLCSCALNALHISMACALHAPVPDMPFALHALVTCVLFCFTCILHHVPCTLHALMFQLPLTLYGQVVHMSCSRASRTLYHTCFRVSLTWYSSYSHVTHASLISGVSCPTYSHPSQVL